MCPKQMSTPTRKIELEKCAGDAKLAAPPEQSRPNYLPRLLFSRNCAEYARNVRNFLIATETKETFSFSMND